MGVLQDVTSNDVIDTNATKLMVCILIDSSYSMIENRKIAMVNEGIKAFIKSGKENMYAKDGLDVCMITFGGTEPKVIQEFANIQKINFKDIRPSGQTPLKKALELAITKINQRKEFWRNMGASIYHPWLIVLSDGKSDDDISGPAIEIQRMYKEHKLKGKCIGVGDGSETPDLRKIAPNGNVEEMKALEIKDYFDMLSRSAAQMSMSAPDVEDYEYEINV